MMQHVYVSGFSPEAAVLTFEDGKLTLTTRWNPGPNATYLVLYEDTCSCAQYCYAANRDVEGGASCTSSYALDESAVPRPLNPTLCYASGTNSCYVSVHPSGKWVCICNWASGTLAVFPRTVDGKLDECAHVVSPGKNTHQTVWADGGRRVYVPAMGDDIIQVYDFEVGTGALRLIDTVTFPAGSGPRHLCLTSDERTAYLVSESACTVTVLTRDSASGALTVRNTASALPSGCGVGPKAAAIVLTPDEKLVYVGIRGSGFITDRVVGFAITNSVDDADECLKCVGAFPGDPTNECSPRLSTPRDMTLDTTGSFLLVANQTADNITVFRVHPTSGCLEFTQVVAVPGCKPTCIRVLPSGH